MALVKQCVVASQIYTASTEHMPRPSLNVSSMPPRVICRRIAKADLSFTTPRLVRPARRPQYPLNPLQLCNEKEVLAQVKIRFDATNGVEHILTRRSQLTVKKSTRQFKTLEGSLVSITNGERSAISSRVAELDQLMPHYLGVSKAVLDNVIFCHQEESLWPMSEPSKLKIKFDEIFEALKYTKAIDNLKQVRKAQNIRLDKLKLNEKFTKENKDKGEKAERQSKLLDAELNGLREEITELEAKVREAEHEHQEAWDHAAKYNHVVESLNAKEEKRVWLEKDVSGLRQDLQERSESDEWLQCEVDQYEERTAVHEQIRQQQLKQYDSLTRAIDEGVKKLSNKHIEAGKYEEQRDNHEQDIERRKGLIRDSSRRHSIRGYDTDLDDMQINEYMARISRLSKDQTAAVEKARRETEREVNRARELLSKLGERKSALNTERNSLKQQSDANDRNIGIFLADINAIEFDESGKAILQSKIEDIAARLQKAKDDSKKGSWDSKLQESNAQLRAIKDESEQLNRDLVQGTKQASELARLAHWKDEVEDRKRNLEKMKAVHGVRLKKLLNQSWAPSSLEVEFQKAVDQKTRQLKEAERQRELVSRTLEQVNYKLSNAGTDIKKVEKEIAACVKRLKDSAECEPVEYAKTLSEMQEARDLFKADSDNFENLRKYFTKGIETAQKKHECNMCQRAFHGAEEREFVARLRQKLANETAAQVQKDLDDAEEDLRKAKEAGPSHATWVRLSTVELPKLREEIKRLGLDREKILSETEHHDQAVKEHEAARVDVESLAKPVRDITKNYQESVNLSGQINEFTANQIDIGMSRTLDEIQEQLEVNGGRSQSLENTIAKIRTDKECARSQISTLELDLTKEKSKLSDTNHQLDRKAIMYKQIEELGSVNQEHQGTAKQLALQLQELEPQICEEQTKLDDLTQRGQDKEKALQQEASKLADTVHKLELAERNIQVYLQDGGPAKLARCQREIDNIQREMDQGKAERNRVTVSINKIKEEIDRHREIRRTILDNIKYRQRVRDLEICRTEIANLSAQNDEADRAHWQRQATHWRHILDEVLARKQSKIGTAKAKDEQLGKLIEDWQTDYKDSAVEYKKAHIEVEVTKRVRAA